MTNSVSAAESGFVDIFDGKTLNGWKLIGGSGRGYIVEDGKIICPKDGGGNLFTEKEYGNFVLRFDFKLDEGSNNGIGIRAPYQGDAAYMGMEIQVLMTIPIVTKERFVPNSITVRFMTRSRRRKKR